MAKEYINGWVVKVETQYLKQKGGLTKLLREAKFFEKLKDAQKCEQQNQGMECAILPAAKNTTTGNMRLKKGEKE
ncbi:hypothetical protein COU00_03935 [Candidatus Falkowbacteria bacterium CG10_big_fil_rev_8_21_14_0_10_43_11]|uniref:Uncharacterized protein n=1 Tax=Candidatus Falkowbacteria bacterium CG10_big_fil_rev_8_21_14_0_10_43_11 TaxID=1974568 RepID=A0A2M6WL79_9BACT|nr:MAG: hypothetical protein COU00_03935 [Candidatus Falkowbacteria bacterium CG10_big_fil_rev_8_21_14_0_10_43_11]